MPPCLSDSDPVAGVVGYRHVHGPMTLALWGGNYWERFSVRREDARMVGGAWPDQGCGVPLGTTPRRDQVDDTVCRSPSPSRSSGAERARPRPPADTAHRNAC